MVQPMLAGPFHLMLEGAFEIRSEGLYADTEGLLTPGFSAITEVVDTYSFTGDYKLLITKLDETKYRGMVLNTAHYAKKPLAYVTTGQNVPDDLEAANTELLAKQILER